MIMNARGNEKLTRGIAGDFLVSLLFLFPPLKVSGRGSHTTVVGKSLGTAASAAIINTKVEYNSRSTRSAWNK